MNANNSIPLVDMHNFLHGNEMERLQAAQIFGESLQKIGFVAVTNVGINPKTIDDAYALAEEYFNLPYETKMQQRAVDGLKGFIPFGTEHAKYTDIIDLKEFYHTSGPTQPKELWPDLPHFKEKMTSLYLELESCMKYCLQATAIYLGYKEPEQQTILSDLLVSGNGLMRILHYPPIDPIQNPPGAVRSAAHEDLGIMTIIPRATRPGLQVKSNNGEWLDVVVPSNAAIVNSADTLSRITNGIIPSTTHRVVNPPINDFSHRYSIPFFGSLPFHTVLRVLEKCRSNIPESLLPKEITFGEFLNQRYQEIGLKD